MALTPEGTPYVESTDLVANYPAASLSLANRVDLVGVLPFATSAARATAIPSPTDGQYSYLQDSNSTEFWNGSAWVAAGVAPGLVHINTTTFTTQSSVSIDDVFSTTYDNYVIHLVTTAASAADPTIRARMRVGGSDNTTANYNTQRLLQQNTTVSGTQNPGGNTFWTVGHTDSTYPNACGFHLTLFSPFLSKNTLFWSDDIRTANDAAVYQDKFGGVLNLSTSFTAITFLTSSGTMSGTVRIYGYKNS